MKNRNKLPIILLIITLMIFVASKSCNRKGDEVNGYNKNDPEMNVIR